MVISKKFLGIQGKERLVSLFFTLCQILFTISILGKVAALHSNSQAYLKTDFILGISQITVMRGASLLELLIVILLGSKIVASSKKLFVLLAVATGFVTYHVWGWIQGYPSCPCMGSLFSESVSAKISSVTAVVLFLTSAYLLLMHKGSDQTSSTSATPTGTGPTGPAVGTVQ